LQHIYKNNINKKNQKDMKKFLFLAMLFTANMLNAQNKLTIVVDGIETAKGKILIGVYDSANFLKKPAYAVAQKVNGNEITVTIDSVATGTYAVSIIHDENDNNKLDVGSYGIPIEKTGFSNNARGKAGAPSFNDCMFSVDEDTVIYITLWKFEIIK
jgi:uncharacterized protein (DUF2141 family)